MSEEPEDSYDARSDAELESLLRKLEPTDLSADFVSELRRDHARIAANAAHDPLRPHWRRVIPLTIVSCLAMIGYGLFQYGPAIPEDEAATVEASSTGLDETTTVPAPVAPGLDRFVPVSAQGYLIDSSSEGVIETEDGPRRKVKRNYRDAYHWHDPETGTNIRFFQPRNEEVIVPLRTD